MLELGTYAWATARPGHTGQMLPTLFFTFTTFCENIWATVRKDPPLWPVSASFIILVSCIGNLESGKK